MKYNNNPLSESDLEKAHAVLVKSKINKDTERYFEVSKSHVFHSPDIITNWCFEVTTKQGDTGDFKSLADCPFIDDTVECNIIIGG